MSQNIKLRVDFDKLNISDGVIDFLSSNLKEDINRDDMKISLKESLAMVHKGTKLQNGPANNLLTCILRALSIEENDLGDETFQK